MVFDVSEVLAASITREMSILMVGGSKHLSSTAKLLPDYNIPEDSYLHWLLQELEISQNDQKNHNWTWYTLQIMGIQQLLIQ
jgi:hypothetical protein